MNNVCIQIKGTTLQINKMIEQELDLQFEMRERLEAMEERRKFNGKYQELSRGIQNSCERVRNYFSIADHHNSTIGVRKGKFNQF